MRVLVTGASGLLGLNLCLMKSHLHQITGTINRRKLSGVPFHTISVDFEDGNRVAEIIDTHMPDLIINCAAMANVDQCETHPIAAERINAGLPEKLAQITSSRKIKLIQISTDAVFDGEHGGYSEIDQPNPLSIYAKTKREGERGVMENDPNAIVARVNFYGFSITGKRSLAEFFLGNLKKRNLIKGFNDVVFSPLYVRHLVDILFSMAEENLCGLYHVVCAEKLSKYTFGQSIAEKFGLDANFITQVSFQDSGLKAMRSPNLFLDVSKLEATGIKIPSLEGGITAFYNDFQEGWHERLRSYGS